MLDWMEQNSRKTVCMALDSSSKNCCFENPNVCLSGSPITLVVSFEFVGFCIATGKRY